MSFDRLAPHYRWLERILAGDLLQQCRTRWLGEVTQARRALLVGEGNGRMLGACALALPTCEFTVVDQSPAMLAQARRRWHRGGGPQTVAFEQADLRAWQPPQNVFDLVVTHFFLDCFAPNELERVVGNIDRALTRQARWLMADFCLPPHGWRRARAHAVLALAYGFFRWTTGISARAITPPEPRLHSAGFSLLRRQYFNQGLLHSDLWTRQT